MSAARSRATELDAEQEIDFGRYAASLAARWWLPLLGLLLGAVLGLLLSSAGEQSFRAQALVYLGDPFAPSGARIATLSTSPSAIREIVVSEAAVRRAASEAGLSPDVVRQGIFIQQLSAERARATEPTLVNIGVRGDAPRRLAVAANELARIVVARISGYVNAKMEGLRGQIAAAGEELDSLERRIQASLAIADAGGVSPTDKQLALLNVGVLEQRRSTVIQTRSDRQQLLTLAENVEAPRIVQPAAPRRVAAEGRRNEIVAAAVLGLLVGVAAALLWDPVTARIRPAVR